MERNGTNNQTYVKGISVKRNEVGIRGVLWEEHCLISFSRSHFY